MRLRHLASSSVVVESGDTKVLCDPWLRDGAYYGSWAHYPPVDVEPEALADVDAIYISHIHPDHFHQETLERLNDDVPVYIHDYRWEFLRKNIERLGFEVIELPHDERVHLGGDLHLNVLASDDCDPEACGSYFGCGWWMDAVSGGHARGDGSTQIDSMGVFDDGEHVIVNANDCRWPMSRQAAARVKESYDAIDLLLMQYSAANFYPQCMADYTPEQKRAAASSVIQELYGDAESFIRVFEPDYFMPFAGSYTLAGSLADLNDYLAVPARVDAAAHFEHCGRVPDGAEAVLLNCGEHFDLERETASAPYAPVDPVKKRRYVRETLADRRFEYEDDPMPELEDFEELVPEAYESFEAKRREVQFESDTTVHLELVDDVVAELSMAGDGFELVPRREANGAGGYVRMSMDPRLLHRILRGPRFAHFNNAQIGSHISFAKEPDVYERPLYYCMSFFHA